MRRWYVTVRPDNSVFLTAYGDNGSHFAFDAALLPEDAADIEDILNRGERDKDRERKEASLPKIASDDPYTNYEIGSGGPITLRGE